MSGKTLSRGDFLRLLALAGGGWLVSCSQAKAIPTIIPTADPMFTQGIPTPTSTPAPTRTAKVNIREKIDTVIILLEENHTFDSLFSTYPDANGVPSPIICPDAIHHPILGGALAIDYDCVYKESQVPNYWKLAQYFTLCDNYYSEVRLPSFPNYLMLTSAQTPILRDPLPPYKCPYYCVDLLSMANRLDERGLTWHDYGGLFANIKSLEGRPEISYRSLDGFFQSAFDGRLANVSWIGTFLVGGGKASGHPPANICDAENYAVEIINAAMASPQWPTMMVIVIWDEWGGFYDHVVPPVIDKLPNGRPFRYGYRVPCLVVSPYSLAGRVVHTEFSHVSTLTTIESIFDLTPLTALDAAANSLLECLDLTQPPITPFSLAARTCTS